MYCNKRSNKRKRSVTENEADEACNKRNRKRSPSIEYTKTSKNQVPGSVAVTETSKGKSKAQDRLNRLRAQLRESPSPKKYKKSTSGGFSNAAIVINDSGEELAITPLNKSKLLSSTPKTSPVNERLFKIRKPDRNNGTATSRSDSLSKKELCKNRFNESSNNTVISVYSSSLSSPSNHSPTTSALNSFLVVSEVLNSDSKTSGTPKERIKRRESEFDTTSSSNTLTPGLSDQSTPVHSLNCNLFKNEHISINSSIDEELKSTTIQNTSNETKNSINDRLKKIKKQSGPLKNTDSTPQNNSYELLKIDHSIKMDKASMAESSNSVLKKPCISRTAMVEDWVGCQQSVADRSMTDSMVANFNSTLFNNSILLREPQEDDSMDWNDDVAEPTNQAQLQNLITPLKSKDLCVVTDTNIFLHEFLKLKDLLDIKLKGGRKLVIYLPWMVLKELDHLKDHSGPVLKSQALKAQKFINKHLIEPNPKIIGQSVQDVCQQIDLGKCPDDKILAACFQAQEKYESVILLSNDINLHNKAITSNIEAYRPKELIQKLKTGIFTKVKAKLEPLLTDIIIHACKEAFGNVYLKMDMLQNPPWTFFDCLLRLKRYWSTVFQSLLLKQCYKTLEALIALSKTNEISDSDTGKMERFQTLLTEFLFFLSDIQQFNKPIKNVRYEIDKIFNENL